MTRKEMFKTDILLKMKHHLEPEVLSMLEVILSEELYRIDIVELQTLPATRDMTNEYILSLYELKKGTKLTPQTMKSYMITFRVFLRYVNKSLVQVTQDDVEHFLRQKLREGNNNKSLNNKRRKLNALFDWMRKSGFIQVNPVENIEPFKEVLSPIDHLEPEEMEALKAACKTKRDRAILEWFRCTAARNGEIPQVKINQINWAAGKVVIFGHKGHAYRTVCLDAVALKYLLEYIEERGLDIRSQQPLFTHCVGDRTRPLGTDGLYLRMRNLGQQAGLNRRVYPHLFRKTTATNIIKRGGNNDDAGEYLGHKPQGVAARHYTFRSEEHTVKIFRNYVAAV